MIDEFKRVGLLRADNRMIVHQNTRIANSGALRNPIRAAQAAVADHVSIIGGADIDTLDGSYRYDGTHFTEAGGAAQAALKLPIYSGILTPS